jgi:menaquinone-dependent protoporphyrinogen oxidase
MRRLDERRLLALEVKWVFRPRAPATFGETGVRAERRSAPSSTEDEREEEKVAMKVLVAYASRHGATRGIAERIAQRLEYRGLDAVLQPVASAAAAAEYDAFVVGGAAYMTHWMEEATRFVRQNVAVLASHPVWLFSSGPVGTETVDPKGRDVLEASVPMEFAEFAAAIKPVDQRVFFGAYDPDAKPVGFLEALGARFTRLPAIREALPAGDFRDWPQIEAWADGIARQLQAAPVSA